MEEFTAQEAFSNACDKKQNSLFFEKSKILKQIKSESLEGKMQTKVNIEQLAPDSVGHLLSYFDNLGFKTLTARVKNDGFQGVTMDLYLVISWGHIKKGDE